MLRKILAVCAALMLVLSACGDEETVAGGMLSRDEIERMESLYFTDRETALEGLGFSEKDIDSDSEDYLQLSSAGAYPLKKGRSIGGRIYRQIVNTSIVAPEGFIGIRLYALFDDQQEAESARDALLDVAAELYGEPVYPGTERWMAGELTELAISFFRAEDAANFDPSWDYRYSLEVEYKVQSVVDGKKLTGEEIAERVRNTQEKRK